MRTNFDFTPYRRSTVGFDRLFDLLETGTRADGADGYPPFDIAKQGYVSLLTGEGAKSPGDSPEMVEARADFIAAGHFQPLIAALQTEARATSHSTRSAVTAPLLRLSILRPDLAPAAQAAATATYGLRGTSGESDLATAREYAIQKTDAFVKAAGSALAP